MSKGSRRAVVVGQGYVGLPLAMRAVLGRLRSDRLRGGRHQGQRPQRRPLHVEDITATQVAEALATGRYRATSDPADLAGFDIAVISVPTPMGEGVPDLSFIESAARTTAPHVTVGSTVILESTTYPGTTEELVGPILESGSGLRAGADFHLGYSPERIDPGNSTWRLENTPKVVSGIDERSLAAVQGFFDDIVDTTVAVKGTREAELTKLLENTFRHVNIALVNELAMFARTWASTSGRPSTPPRPSRSGTCASLLGRVSAGTACPSTRRTCHGRWNVPSARRSGSWNWPTTSTSTCPTTSCGASRPCSTTRRRRSTARRCSCTGWPTRPTPATPARPRHDP
ncbi:MAG: hypothetical protein M5U19_07045 [Microthrixaceae bacterium]|nr:hypothetical protein [Microthrixaceae bacterium]